MSDETKSQKQTIIDLIKHKFDTNQVDTENLNKAEINKLKKIILDELKLKAGNGSDVRNYILDEAQSRGFSILGSDIKSKKHEPNWNLIKKEPEIPPEIKEVVEQDERTKQAFEMGQKIGQESQVRGALPISSEQKQQSPHGTLPATTSQDTAQQEGSPRTKKRAYKEDVCNCSAKTN